MTNDEMEMYLLLCGWNFIKSEQTNPYWKGGRAWYRPKAHGFLRTEEAYGTERKNNGFND